MANEVFTDDQLVYAERHRCPCGAGLAYVKSRKDMDYWDCSDILTRRAPTKDQLALADRDPIQHTGKLPFTFYEIRSERQPGAGSTRPKEDAR